VEVDAMPCRHLFVAGLIAALTPLAAGCGQKSSAAQTKAEQAAKVPKDAPKEDKLNEIELSPKAEERLGIATAPIEKKPVLRVRTYGGEVVLPTGASLIVTAPLGGFLKPPVKGGIPKAGEPVKKGQPMYVLVSALSKEQSVLPPADRVNLIIALTNLAQSRNDAQAQVKQTAEQLRLAKIELERQEMLVGGAGTRAALDRAKSAHAVAEAAYEFALERKKLWDDAHLNEDEGTFKSLVIESPEDGIIRTETATANQAVAAGAPLFEVMNTKTVWVKVPVYVGELGEIDVDQSARLSNLEDRNGAKAVVAKPVSAPPTATPLASTADLYYEVDNEDGRFRPGQKMNAGLPLRDEQEALVVPYSAIVYDILGGSWVYESLGDHKYARRRVQVKYVVNNTAVLANGPPAGSKIVSEGAIELLGTEFFVSK
jgi:RND family efflux transporter MFP subunit